MVKNIFMNTAKVMFIRKDFFQGVCIIRQVVY